jgi:hypothetical protein
LEYLAKEGVRLGVWVQDSNGLGFRVEGGGFRLLGVHARSQQPIWTLV